MAINNDNNKLVIAGGVTLLAEPLLVGLMHGGGVGAVVGLVAGGAAYIFAEDMAGKGQKVSAPSLPVSVNTSKLAHFGYRMVNGKSAREQGQPKDGRTDERVTDPLPDVSFDVNGDEDIARPYMAGEYFLFSEVLANFQPSTSQVFLARTDKGVDLYCAPRDLCHVALAGSTGGGKSSIMRMLMLQLCKSKLQVLLLNPHYTDYDLEAYGPDGKPCPEDWTPFKPYLIDDPIRCMNPTVIEHYLKQAATDIIPRRLEKRAKGQSVGKPYFIVIDELPSIVKSVKMAPDYMSTILREGRKTGVFLISASQDFLVRTIAPDGSGGAVRDCYRTAFYVGGDTTTAKVLLDMAPKEIHEDELGKGVVMLRGSASKKASQVHVPYVDNESLYVLLGPSTYKQAIPEPDIDLRPATDAATSLLPETIMVTPERFPDWQFRNGQPIASPYYEQTIQQPVTPPIQQETSGRMAADVNLSMAIKVWNKVHPSVRDMEGIFELNNNQARRLRKMIKDHPDTEQWDEEEK